MNNRIFVFMNTPDLSKLRRVVFWDTDFDKINWIEKETAVVQRVFERGNDDEKAEIIRFYGQEKVDLILKDMRPGNR